MTTPPSPGPGHNPWAAPSSTPRSDAEWDQHKNQPQHPDGQPEYAGGPSPYAAGQPYPAQPSQAPVPINPTPYPVVAPPYAGGPASPYPPLKPAPPVLPDGMMLASVWKRLGAAVLDQIFILAAMLPLAMLLMGLFGVLAASTTSGDSGAAVGIAIVLIYGLMFLGGFALMYFYFIHRVRQVGATFGKQVLGLRIRSLPADGQLTWGQVWGRWGTNYVLNGFTGGIGGLVDVLWCLWDERRQCLHDKAVGTVVIDHSLPILPPDHPDVLRARAMAMPRGWVADGPSPMTPPGYPRHPAYR